LAFNTAPGRAKYTATSGQTSFPFVFKIYNDTDIEVYKTLSGQDADEAIDILVLNTDYTVSINGDDGGTITLLSSTGSNDTVVLQRNLPEIREIEYQTNGDLLASTLNSDQNYQTYLIADGVLAGDRYFKLSANSTGVSNILPSPEALNFLQWNEAEDALVNGDLVAVLNSLMVRVDGVATASQTEINISPYLTAAATLHVNGVLLTEGTDYTESGSIITLTESMYEDAEYSVITSPSASIDHDQVFHVETIEDLATANFLTTPTIVVRDTLRGGTFNYDASQSAVNDGGLILNGWVREFEGAISPLWFGANTTREDNEIPINAALATGYEVRIPAGEYVVSDSITTQSHSTMRGAGESLTSIKLADDADAHVINMDGKSDVIISDLAVDGNRANQTIGVHGVRIDNSHRITLKNLYIHDTFHYGIGAQTADVVGEYISDIIINSIRIVNTGGDGIDVKDHQETNERIMLSNITVVDWGLNSALSTQAAIDARGSHVIITDCICEISSGRTDVLSGVRLRESYSGDTIASKSGKIHNVNIVNNSTTLGEDGILARGIDSIMSNCSIDGFAIGIKMSHEMQTVSACKFENCTTAVAVYRYTTDAQPVGCIITGSSFKDCTTGVLVYDGASYTSIENNSFWRLTTEIDVSAASTHTIIANNTFLNSDALITDTGEVATIRDNEGYRTSNNVLTTGLSIETLGRVTGSFSHLLKTGNDYGGLRKVALTFTVDGTNHTDYEVSSLRTTAMDATTVNFEFWVTNTSATGGATIAVVATIVD